MISRVIVIGTSAGGMHALKKLVSQLPENFPAAIFIVQHMAPICTTHPLVYALAKAGKLPVSEARDKTSFSPGHIYLASPDHHLLIFNDTMRVTKGARENGSRPGIDPLFRSAAIAYQSKVIGVILTGYLDDGTAGLAAIQRCGGICIVQDPRDADYPDMPLNALNGIVADHTVPLADMGGLLLKLVGQEVAANRAVPKDIAIEARIAERVLSDLPAVNALGDQAPFNCPNCGGVLWQIDEGQILRFRCHTGHSFTAASLLAAQDDKIEETLWVALRMFEERRNLLIGMSTNQNASTSIRDRVKESEIHIERIRAMLTSSD